jgi:hypothetical protein
MAVVVVGRGRSNSPASQDPLMSIIIWMEFMREGKGHRAIPRAVSR